MKNSAQLIQELQNGCALQERQIAELTAKVSWYGEQFRPGQKQCFGLTSEQSDQYQFQPFIEAGAQAVLENHISHVYTCRREREGISTPIITAPMSAPPLPGSIAPPSAIAHIMTGKYVDGPPFYRLGKSLSRLSIGLSRRAMANWMIKSDGLRPGPLYGRLYELVSRCNIVHGDEATPGAARRRSRGDCQIIRQKVIG